ncbi:hypothetical protein [Streptomyces sp. NPDC050263]|uniref:hypothetical protein n=1 Tax=Streptomyces sp. NPDC050263 TaxID=3155037 RepID=UPI00343AD8E5
MTLQPIRSAQRHCPGGPVALVDEPDAGVWSGPAVMPVNIVAPYLLTALVRGPRRLVYLSSGSHFDGRPSTDGVDWRGTKPGSYADSKLFVTTLTAAVARLYPDVLSNAVDPGWVPTKMGGPGAPDDLQLGHQTQQWLASSDDLQALTTGGYWYHRERQQPHPAVHDEAFQDRLLQALAEETGTALDVWWQHPSTGGCGTRLLRQHAPRGQGHRSVPALIRGCRWFPSTPCGP